MGKRYFLPITWLDLRRSALKVTKRICKLGSGISKMWAIFAPSPEVIGHVTRRLCSEIVKQTSNIRRKRHRIVEIYPSYWKSGRRGEWRNQIFDRKLKNSRFCACAV